MKNWTLALAIGTAVTSTVIGTVNPVVADPLPPPPPFGVSGPGGGGGVIDSSAFPTITWGEYFTGVGPNNYLDKILRVAAPGQTYTYIVNVRNDSSITWTDFHFEIIGSQAGTLVSFLNPPGTSSVFTTGTGNATTIDWVGGTVADDGGTAFDDVTFGFQINTSAGFTGNTFTVRQYATPEPLTILGTGVVLGALPVLKKEYAKRNKKKDGDA